MKFTESGRSMVEMLAVLAITGILSVGGLYGYTVAMKKHEVNEMIGEVNFRANQVATQLLLGAAPESVTNMESAFLSSGAYSFNAIKIPLIPINLKSL